jgi:hypothetical protein
MGRWLTRRVARDHLPIAGCQLQPNQDYYAFCVFAAVAPSRSPKPLPLVDFVDHASKLVERFFPGEFPAEPEYVGPELVRYRLVREGVRYSDHVITIYPTGLIEVQWAIAVPPGTGLPLTEAVAVVERLRQAVQSDSFADLHQRRRWAKWRRVDWRFGINGRAVPEKGNSTYWTDVLLPGGPPTRRASDPRPHCPREGYASGRLKSKRRTAQLEEVLAPALHELLASGGYISGEEIRERVANLLAVAGRPQLEAAAADDPPELESAD